MLEMHFGELMRNFCTRTKRYKLKWQTHLKHRFHFWIFVLDMLKKFSWERRFPRFCLRESKVDVANCFNDGWIRICWMPATHNATPIYTYVRLTLKVLLKPMKPPFHCF